MTNADAASRPTRRLGVLGTFVWDTIHHPARPEEPPLEQWGGIAYSLSAFGAACPVDWTVVPLIRIGADLADEARRFLGTLPRIGSLDGLRVVDQPTNRVELRYSDLAQRTERLTGGISPWPWSELHPLLSGLDALYVNHISGYELELETALAVRADLGDPIYADLHSLFLGPPGDGPRRPRPLPGAERWLRTADYIQVNDAELALLGHPGMDGRRRVEGPGEGRSHSPYLLVTRGSEGATFRRLGASSSDELSIPVPGGPIAGDPTGCGDVWGAVVFCGLLEGLPLREAMLRGHRAAAAKLTRPRMDGLSQALARTLVSAPDS